MFCALDHMFLFSWNQHADSSDIYSCSGKIIECSWNPEEKVWVFMRTRADKSTPNEFNTYKKVCLVYISPVAHCLKLLTLQTIEVALKNWQVMRSINDNITEEVVLNEIHGIVRLPMYADRIRKDCRTFIKTAQRKW